MCVRVVGLSGLVDNEMETGSVSQYGIIEVIYNLIIICEDWPWVSWERRNAKEDGNYYNGLHMRIIHSFIPSRSCPFDSAL